MEGRSREAVRWVFIRAKYLLSFRQWLVIIIIAFAGIYYDRPSGRKDRLVDIQVVGLEGIAAKDGGNGNCLAIG